MLAVPADVLKAFTSLLASRKTPNNLFFHYQKWLRYYLDFCYKYHHIAADSDSLGHFMHKLNEKNQTAQLQKQATDAILIYYQLLKSAKDNTVGKQVSPASIKAQSRTISCQIIIWLRVAII